MSKYLLIISASLIGSLKAFSIGSIRDRRCFLAGATSMLSVSSLISTPKVAYADVSDGNALPEGAAQFGRVHYRENSTWSIALKFVRQAVNKRLSEQPDAINRKEWDNIGDFIRLVYKCGDDMKLIAKSTIYDGEKMKKADEIVSVLQKLAQASDEPISKENPEALLKITKKISILVNDFFELLRDVPDEL